MPLHNEAEKQTKIQAFYLSNWNTGWINVGSDHLPLLLAPLGGLRCLITAWQIMHCRCIFVNCLLTLLKQLLKTVSALNINLFSY